jgi:nicotinamidase-related amidase
MHKILFLPIIFCLSCLSCFSQKKDQLEDKFLLVLDVQEYYTNGKLSKGSAQKLIDSVNCAIDHAKPSNVIYIKSFHRLLNLALSYPFIYVSYDLQAMRLDKRMKLVSKYFFTNDDSSVFAIKSLNDFLKHRHAKEIVIVGLMAEEHVFESLKEGKALGYDMYVIPEAIVGESQKSKDKAIKQLTEGGIKLLNINNLNPEP